MSLINFVNEDVPRTLFPLDSPRIVIERGEAELSKFIDSEIFSKQQYHPHFTQAPVAHSLKSPLSVRRVHLLDPVATLFLYRFVYSNAKHFREPSPRLDKRSYGYHFKGKAALNATEEHQQFRARIVELKKIYRYFAKLDVANCFSGFYHHDLVSALKTRIDDKSVDQFGTFLRELNAGRSVSCFPHGYFPSKAIGNLYLTFIEENVNLRSPAIIRFVDDIYIFNNSRRQLELDIFRLQELLSSRNLFLNSAKTEINSSRDPMKFQRTDEIRKALLAKRAEAIELAYDEEPSEVHLSGAEFAYLSEMIGANDVAEQDVELALTVITEDEEHAERLAELVFSKYPHLIKSLYTYLSSTAYDGGALFALIKKRVTDRSTHEFILFWCARILLRIFAWDQGICETTMKIYNHPNSNDVVKAQILEDPRLDFGLLDTKQHVLQSSGSSLMAIAAATGLRELELAKRNQLYKYASQSSPLMSQICNILSKKVQPTAN